MIDTFPLFLSSMRMLL
jgi:hypothetical protein